MALSKGSAKLGAYLPDEGSRTGFRNTVGFKKFGSWTKYKNCLDGRTDHLVVPFVKRPTHPQGSSGFLLILPNFSNRTCFGVWLPSSGGRECLISYPSNSIIVYMNRLTQLIIYSVNK
jgi:hypothetical protein